MALHTPRGHAARFALVALIVLAAVAALAAALPARAQIALPLLPCQDIVAPRPLTTAVRPAGLPPQLGGSCTAPIIESNATGAAVAWWCPRAAPQPPLLHLYAVRWDYINATLLLDYATLGLPGDNAERVRAMTARYQNQSVWDMCDVWEPMRERINAAMPAPAPAPTWVVAKYSLLPTRPAFAVVAGKRSAVSSGRATVGKPCDCAAPLVDGLLTWCPADSAPLVTQCTRL